MVGLVSTACTGHPTHPSDTGLQAQLFQSDICQVQVLSGVSYRGRVLSVPDSIRVLQGLAYKLGCVVLTVAAAMVGMDPPGYSGVYSWPVV